MLTMPWFDSDQRTLAGAVHLRRRGPTNRALDHMVLDCHPHDGKHTTEPQPLQGLEELSLAHRRRADGDAHEGLHTLLCRVSPLLPRRLRRCSRPYVGSSASMP